MVLVSSKVRALGLCSGGLDSMLAAKILQAQGIEVSWICFETPFFLPDKSIRASELTGIPLQVKNITPEYIRMLKNPPAGYGKNMNPCLDCHSLMFRFAFETLKEGGYDFLFSGEVVGQRPMSQRKQALRYVEKHSGADGFIIRPLSAQLLPETQMEKDGRVKREQLLSISGRSRKDQMKLAESFGISEYPTPAGGCLLTDPGYSRRLRDLFEHKEACEAGDFELLKYGRHIRLSSQTKIIVGRNHAENIAMEKLFYPNGYCFIFPQSFSGPRVLVSRPVDREALLQAAAICVGYSKVPPGEPAQVKINNGDDVFCVETAGIPPRTIESMIIQ